MARATFATFLVLPRCRLFCRLLVAPFALFALFAAFAPFAPLARFALERDAGGRITRRFRFHPGR